MRLWRRSVHAPGSQAARSRVRRAGWVALFATPVLGITVLALAASGVMGTLAQGPASIINTNNQVRAQGAGLTESQNDRACPAVGNGEWNDCDDINKFGGGSLTSGQSAGPQTVTLTNTGDTQGSLFLLPSACTNSVTGASVVPGVPGDLCGAVTIRVSCTNGAMLGPENLINLFLGRNPTPTPSGPSGYPMGTIPAGESIMCTFELMAGTIPNPGGTISQPLAWKLVA